MNIIDQAKAALGEHFTFFFEIIHAQLQRLDLEGKARILDVGTGMGRTAVTLALCGHRVLTGEPQNDESEYAKQAWRAEAQKAGVEDLITFQAFDAEKMPFGDHEFDAVFMVGALHHMATPATALAEASRVLAPKGVICIVEPNSKMLEVARSKFPNHPDPTDPRPLVQGMAIEVFHDEMFDIFMIRH